MSTKSELALFSLPPTQVAVEKTSWLEVPLSNACTNEGPYEFHLPPSPHMLHLSKNYLFLELKIVRADGANLTHGDANADPLVGPINLIGKTFCGQVQLYLNGTEVFNSGNKYAYRAYLETVLNHGQDSKKSQLQAALYCEDTPPHIDDDRNAGFQERAGHFENSVWVQTMAPIHSDLFTQDRYLLNQIDLRMVLHRNPDNFGILCFAANPNAYKIQVNAVRWFIKTVEVGSSVLMGIERALSTYSAKYPIRRVEIKSMNVAAGLQSTQNNSIFSGQLPRRVVIGCVESAAFHGTYNRSPFNFQNFGIRQVSITAGGQMFPSKPLQMAFGTNQFTRAFVQLFEGLGIGGENKGNCINRDAFKNGSCLFAFDLSPDEDDGSHWDLIKDGSVSVNIEFAAALGNPVEVVVYAEFDNLLTIDQHRNPTVDYRL